MSRKVHRLRAVNPVRGIKYKVGGIMFWFGGIPHNIGGIPNKFGGIQSAFGGITTRGAHGKRKIPRNDELIPRNLIKNPYLNTLKYLASG
jgi:hypothetical protein